ncbi:MAG: iron transporter [Halalkalicoccus sp.]
MRRRDALCSGLALFGGLGGASLSGCLDALGSQSAWRDLVVDRPEEIYVPSKTDGMTVWAGTESDEYALALSATRPHRFWTVTGRETNQIAMRDAHSVHLMVSLWDPDSKRWLPAEVRLSIERDGERVIDRTLWPMCSQRMGVHYGDNIALPEPGRYDATVRVIPQGIEYRGGFAGGFEPAAFDLAFAYDPEEIETLDLTILEDDRRGRPGAVEPMAHDHRGHDHRDDEDGDGGDDQTDHGGHDHPPVSTVPPPDAFPRVLGDRIVGDYRTIVALAGDGGRYLLVSPRTRYNGFPLPSCSVSTAVERDDGRSERIALAAATHPTFGHHYGASVDTPSGAELTIEVESPPQFARHEGYETAFFDLPSFSLRVPR